MPVAGTLYVAATIGGMPDNLPFNGAIALGKSIKPPRTPGFVDGSVRRLVRWVPGPLLHVGHTTRGLKSLAVCLIVGGAIAVAPSL